MWASSNRVSSWAADKPSCRHASPIIRTDGGWLADERWRLSAITICSRYCSVSECTCASVESKA